MPHTYTHTHTHYYIYGHAEKDSESRWEIGLHSDFGKREYAASVEIEAEIPDRILKLKNSNTSGAAHSFIENLKTFNLISISLYR
jgi:hypothetical protein